VLRRALACWRRRHAGDFRIVAQLVIQRQQQVQVQQQVQALQQQLQLHRLECDEWALQRQRLVEKISSTESALVYERWTANETEHQLLSRTNELHYAHTTTHSFEQQLVMTRSQLEEALAAAASAQADAAAATLSLQTALAENGRLKDAAALHRLRATQLMQQQLQLMQQLEDVKQQGKTFRCVLWRTSTRTIRK